MSYNEIEQTLRSLGVSNNTTPIQIPSTHNTQQTLSSQNKQPNQPITTSSTSVRLKSMRQKTLPQQTQQRVAISLKNMQKQQVENPLSASSKSERSFANHKNKLIRRVENDSRSVSQHHQQRYCQHCHSNSNSQYYEITSRNNNRIDDLENKIKQLEKQIQDKNYNSISFKNSMSEFYENKNGGSYELMQEERKFIHRCVEMTQKVTRVQNPSLKFCWKFIKQHVEQPRSQYLSPNPRLVSPTKETKKSEIVVSDLKNMLHVRHKSDILKVVASMVINQQIYQRIYHKTKGILGLDFQTPSQLLHYLQNKDRKSKKVTE